MSINQIAHDRFLFNRDYYGLEIFALPLLTHACGKVCVARKTGPADLGASEDDLTNLIEDSLALLQANSCVLQLRFFCFPGSAPTPSGSQPRLLAGVRINRTTSASAFPSFEC
jgi:hypothetical protein